MRFGFIVVLVGVLAGGVARASAQMGHAHLLVGNTQFTEGQYEDALKSYQLAEEAFGVEAEGAGRLPAELLHNQAAAHFKLGRVEEARELWRDARELGDAAFGARTAYNLGNCEYAEALKLAEQDPRAALEHLAAATAEYRDAIRTDRSLQDARANLELTQLLRKQIEEQMQQQQQDQQCQDGEQSDEEQQDESKQDQQQSEQDEQQGQEQDQQEQQEGDGDQQEQQQSDQEDRQQSQEQQSDQQQSDEQQQSEQQESQQDQERKEAEQQQSGDQSQEEKQSSEQGQSQAAPGEEGSEGEHAQADQQARQVPIRLTPEQAEQLMQKIRDAEKARRAVLAKRKAAQRQRVERDW